MKKYINISTGKYPFTEAEIRELFPNESIAMVETDYALMGFGFALVHETTSPTFTPSIETVLEIAPTLASGLYTQAWAVVPLTPEQIEARRILAVPRSVSPRQIRQALTRAGLRQQVEAAIAVAEQDMKDWYEFATDFERSNDHVIAMGQVLNVSNRQLDDLWTLAGSL